MKKIYLISALLLLLGLKMVAQPAGWSFSTPYQVQENSGTLITNYQARIVFNSQVLITNGQLQANGNDLRFGKNCSGATLYNYWIESGINTTNTVVWVKIDTLYPSALRTFYMFYGNAAATGASAISGTFNGPMSATDSVASGGPGGVGDSQRGFRFSPNEDILVTSFGKNEPTGTTRYITLFNFTTQAVIAQTQVAGPSGQYTYGNIANPMWLTQGTQYLLELFQGSSDGYYFGTSSQIGQHLTYYDMRYCNSCTQNTFPTNTLSNYHYGYPDLWYYTKTNPTVAPTIGAGTVLTYNALDAAFCAGGSVAVGTTATGGTGPYTYAWSPATGLASTTSAMTTANPAATTTYTITVTDNTGCVTSDQLTVTVNQLPSIAATATNDSICPGGTSVLQVTGTSTSYLWQPGAATTSTVNASPASTTTYTVTGTDANGCTNSTTTLVTVNTPPSVDVTGNYSITCSNSSNALILNATGAATYDWNSGAGSGPVFSDVPTVTQTYTVVGTDTFGCTDTEFYTVNVLPSPVAAASASSDSICSGACVLVTGTATGGSAPYVYSWTPNNITTPSFNACPSTTTCYTFTTIDNNGCSDVITYCVNVNPAATVAVSGENTICEGDSATLVATASNAVSVNWSPASSLNSSTGSTVIATPSVTTTYTVVATTAQGCTDTTTHELIVNPLPTVTYTSPVTTVCLNDGALTLTGGSPAGGSYSGPGVSGVTFTPMMAGNGSHSISYTYSDINGCAAEATQTIVVNPCTGITEVTTTAGVSVFPNPFSTMLTITRVSADAVTVNLFDAEGRLVMSKQTTGNKVEIETAELANGIYTLQLIDATGTKMVRVAKNN